MHLTKRRSLEELTLLDRFLFAETMEDPENLRILLVYISNKLTILHGQSDHLSRRFRSLISKMYSR